TANGHVQTHIQKVHEMVTFRQPTQLYLNDGFGLFDEVDSEGTVLARPLVARGAAYADFDKDGDLDVLLTENHGPAHLWRNDLIGPDRPSSGWVKIRLQGTESNREAIGARLACHASLHVMDRLVRIGTSYISQSEEAGVYGAGDAQRLDSLRVYCLCGRSDHFADVPAGQEILIIEGEGTLRIPAEEGSLSTQLTRR